MAIDQSKCEGCPIDGMFRPVDALGPENARFLIVTDIPSAVGAREGRLLAQGQMGVIGGAMEGLGFTRDDFRMMPSCACAYNPDKFPTKVKREIHKHCRQHLVEEINYLKPDTILPLGADAASAVFGRSTKITKVRGLPNESEEFRIPVFPLMSPLLVVRYPQNRPVFDADIASLERFIDSGFDAKQSTSIEHGNYTLVDDLQFLIDLDPEIISYDTEATGLRWYQQGVDVRTYKPEIHKDNPLFVPRFQILTHQFTIQTGEAFVLVWDHPENPIPESKKAKLRNQMRQLLCKPERIVIGQNPKFDAVALAMTEGIRFRIGGDTLMLAAELDENAMEKNLDMLTKIHAPEMAGYADKFNATYDKSKMWQVPINEIRAYGGGDTDAALRVYLVQEEMAAADDGIWAHYTNVAIPGLNALVGMECRGMLIDSDNELAKFQAFMEIEVARQYASLLAQVPREIKRKHLQDPKMKGKSPEDVLSFGRSAFVKDVLFNDRAGFRLTPRVWTKTTANLSPELREPSTSSKDHLPYFFEACPFTFELAEYIKDERLLSTSVVGFQKKYVVNNMVRPTYSLARAVTGRTNSEDPNGQNYPKRSKKAKAYRKMFKAPPGCYVVEVDLSQAELRVAAAMARDPVMIQIYKDGGDIHRTTAAIVMGMTDAQFEALDKTTQKEARQKAKAVNFGFIFGMGWRKFIVYAKTQYNAIFTEDEAKRVRDGWFRKYSRLAPWHQAVRDFAMRHKFVRSFSGRVRHLPMVDSAEEWIQQEATRQGINSPVQGFSSDLGIMALGRMNEEIDPEALQIVGFVHDAIIAYVKKEYLDWGLKTIKGYMESNPIEEWFGVKLPLPIVADCSFGVTLGDIIEVEHFRLDQPFNFDSLTDKEGKKLITVPTQKLPPNNGRLTRSPYTLDTDLESEEAVRRVTRSAPPPPNRRLRTVVKQEPATPRYTRSRVAITL